MRRQRVVSAAPSQHQMLWTDLWIFGDQALQGGLHVVEQSVRQAAVGNEVAVAGEGGGVWRGYGMRVRHRGLHQFATACNATSYESLVTRRRETHNSLPFSRGLGKVTGIYEAVNADRLRQASAACKLARLDRQPRRGNEKNQVAIAGRQEPLF